MEAETDPYAYLRSFGPSRALEQKVKVRQHPQIGQAACPVNVGVWQSGGILTRTIASGQRFDPVPRTFAGARGTRRPWTGAHHHFYSPPSVYPHLFATSFKEYILLGLWAIPARFRAMNSSVSLVAVGRVYNGLPVTQTLEWSKPVLV